MELQFTASYCHLHQNISITTPPSKSLSLYSSAITPSVPSKKIKLHRFYLGFNSSSSKKRSNIARTKDGIVASSNVSSPFWDSWKPEKSSSGSTLSFSDIFWPSAGAFAAMAIFGKMDQMLAPKGITMTIAPLGAVSAVVFATPSSPAARKYNMFMAQIGCAAIGVLAFSVFGPSWLARSAALAASIAFMIYTRSPHPPAASLPILFIDGVKFHHLNFWYALFPGAAGCVLLCLIWLALTAISFLTLIILQTLQQEIVRYLKDNIKF